MKFKKGKTYEALFLSDVHYGVYKKIKNHHHQDLFRVLNSFRKRGIRFRSLFLVGDILENWYFDSAARLRTSEKKFNKLFDRLDAICIAGGLKYFIVGNHDTTSFRMQLAPEIQEFLEKRGYRIVERFESSEMVVIHGHQGQYNRVNWALDIFVVRMFYWFALLVPGFFKKAESFYNRHLNGRDPTTYQDRIKYYGRLNKITKQGDRVLISGHTHMFLHMPEIGVINTGDWVHSRTLVVQKGRTLIGLRMQTRKKWKKEFEHPLSRQ
ncbi:MAG: metallophosphoesterase [Leptospiraceae bacterium]|nr:metallophosphoesterase [Leptospiraceae bacterium]